MLASANWFSGFDGSVVSHLAMQNSDHCPLLLTVPNAIPVTKRKRSSILKLYGLRMCSAEK